MKFVSTTGFKLHSNNDVSVDCEGGTNVKGEIRFSSNEKVTLKTKGSLIEFMRDGSVAIVPTNCECLVYDTLEHTISDAYFGED